MKASIHQVRADGVEAGQGEKDMRREVNADEQPEAEAEGLLVEGEEQEYILELLMREVPPNLKASVHPTKAKLVTLKGKRKRNLGKKLRKRLKMAKSAAIKEPKKEGKADVAGRKRGQAITGLTRKPEAKGGGTGDRRLSERGLPTALTPTSGGECSG
jgi:hypothetical protein